MLTHARLRGHDLAQFVVSANEDGIRAAQDAARRSAGGARNHLRRVIRQRFNKTGAVFKTRGFVNAIKVKKVADDWWQVIDRSVYAKKRTERFSLAWVFDETPQIASKGGGWVAVPIRGAPVPVAGSGRRYMWPSEAARVGWQLEIVPVMGKPFKVIMARRGREPWQALWLYMPPFRHGRRIDLDSIQRIYAERLETEWDQAFERRQKKRIVRRLG